MGVPTGPLYEYASGDGTFDGYSVTGGLVYRGPLAPLDGRYVFGDFGRFPLDQPYVKPLWSFSFDLDSMTIGDLTAWTLLYPNGDGPIGRLISFGQDGAGTLYLGDLAGNLYAVTGAVPVPVPPTLLLLASGVLGIAALGRRATARRAAGPAGGA